MVQTMTAQMENGAGTCSPLPESSDRRWPRQARSHLHDAENQHQGVEQHRRRHAGKNSPMPPRRLHERRDDNSSATPTDGLGGKNGHLFTLRSGRRRAKLQTPAAALSPCM